MKNTISERIFDFLKEYPPFNLVSKGILTEISRNVEIQYFKKDQIIFDPNDALHENFYMVYEGAVRLYRFVENKKHNIDICDEENLFGLRPLIMNENYLMRAAANEETILPLFLFKLKK